ncbi:MAG: carboxymuconolactone decarboxylase family protein [Hymenobacteraceae bacterium]|nr:carboxymuconolactone decarboxylase family protein [Hymenobacteraceae bacterium]MDX5397718.1 carboxymuconolactone decarboxylase family protein [Hymenobacteraceae bacterium]MDX5513796.1 carboxymuconolactone decarboxylase family protein [Hymenobacteraceae bacterium]
MNDHRINLKNSLSAENLNRKEATLIALATAVNEENTVLTNAFAELATESGATEPEIADAIACASLLSTNNVLYRFRHFAENEAYEQQPARVKMNIMMNPVLGKELFELISLAISAVNGCERCVNAHEESMRKLGASEARIFDAIRLAAVVVGVSKVLR